MLRPVGGFDLYVDSFLKSVDARAVAERKFNIVLDYSYGSASVIFPRILGGLGVETVALNAILDPGRITRTQEEFDKAEAVIEKYEKAKAEYMKAKPNATEAQAEMFAKAKTRKSDFTSGKPLTKKQAAKVKDTVETFLRRSLGLSDEQIKKLWSAFGDGEPVKAPDPEADATP